MLIGTVYCLTGSDIMQIIIDISVPTDHVVVYTKCIFHYSNALQMKGSEQQAALVYFALVREKREKRNFWQLKEYLNCSCTIEHDMLEKII